MRKKFGVFENKSVGYNLATVFFGLPITGWGFLISSFNILVRRRNRNSRIQGSLGPLEVSPGLRAIRNGAATWRALDVIYNWYGHFGIRPNLPTDPLASFWINNMNGRAVRNRLRIIVAHLRAAILDLSNRENEIRILSLASGSAQSLFLAISSLKEEGFSTPVKLLLRDHDKSALGHSGSLAKHYGFPIQDIIFAKARTRSLERLIAKKNFHPHIVEMAGLLDYLRDQKAISLIKRIYDLLPPGGWFIICHIHPNIEQHFLRWVFCWKMLYRTKSEFLKLLRKSAPWNITAITEPHSIHTVAVCRKPIGKGGINEKDIS